MGTEPYVVGFEYSNGLIRNLTCNCSYAYRCKHEVAVMMQLRDALESIRKNYGSVFSEANYFAALSKTDFVDCVMENAKTGDFAL